MVSLMNTLLLCSRNIVDINIPSEKIAINLYVGVKVIKFQHDFINANGSNSINHIPELAFGLKFNKKRYKTIDFLVKFTWELFYKFVRKNQSPFSHIFRRKFKLKLKV